MRRLCVPQVNVSHSAVAFPPCRPGEQACQTLVLSNYGDTPASFSFTNASALKAAGFSVKPLMGVVQPKSHALVRAPRVAGR